MALIVGHQYYIACLDHLFVRNDESSPYVEGQIKVKNSLYIQDQNHLQPRTDVKYIRYNRQEGGVELLDENENLIVGFAQPTIEELVWYAQHFMAFEIEDIVGDQPPHTSNPVNILDITDFVSNHEDNTWMFINDITRNKPEKSFSLEINGVSKGDDEMIYFNSHDIILPMVVDISNRDEDVFSFYKNNIKVYFNLSPEMFESEPIDWYFHKIDVTSLCEITENTISIPFPFLSEDNNLIDIQNHLLTDKVTILFGGTDLNSIQLVNNSREFYGEVNWGNNVNLTIKATNYHFTQNSLQLIADWVRQLFEYEDEGIIKNELDELTSGYDVYWDPSDSTMVHITFYGLYSTNYSESRELYLGLDTENFEIFEGTPIGIYGKSVNDLELRKNPSISYNLVGCEVETFDPITYGETFVIHVITDDGYAYDSNKIKITRNGEELPDGEEWFEDDEAIFINNPYGDIVVTIELDELYEVRLMNGNEILHTFQTPQHSPIKLTQVDTSGDSQFELEFDESYGYFRFTLVVQQGYKFDGLSTSIGSLFVPIDTHIENIDLEPYASNKIVELDVHIQEVYPSTDFEVILYKLNVEKNVVNKENGITLIERLTGTLRESCSVTSPVITIERGGAFDFNYVYIPSFNRYYFVREITNVRKALWNIVLSVDVLMSFRNEILRQNGIIARNEFDYNLKLNDDLRVSLPEYDYEIIEFGDKYNGMFTVLPFDSGMDYVIQVVRG